MPAVRVGEGVSMHAIHKIVYFNPLSYAGWPANHGAWQWGDEFLVGFLEGPYHRSGLHFIGDPWQKRLSRSFDGGDTWQGEEESPQFPADVASLLSPPLALQFSGDWGLRFCGQYDHGGDSGQLGGFYASTDRGRHWQGPFSLASALPGLGGKYYCSTRTAYLSSGLIFVSMANSKRWGMDRVACSRWNGHAFEFVSSVGNNSVRCVMPAVVQMDDAIFVALRCRSLDGEDENWIDLWCSRDQGKSWVFCTCVGETGGANGNPPALLSLPGQRLLCVWGNRSIGTMNANLFDDKGQSLGAEFVFQEEAWCENSYLDFGYPRLFLRSDGVPVCVYYWADQEKPQQHIVATAIHV